MWNNIDDVCHAGGPAVGLDLRTVCQYRTVLFYKLGVVS
jgi:hypothetical protein